MKNIMKFDEFVNEILGMLPYSINPAFASWRNRSSTPSKPSKPSSSKPLNIKHKPSSSEDTDEHNPNWMNDVKTYVKNIGVSTEPKFKNGDTVSYLRGPSFNAYPSQSFTILKSYKDNDETGWKYDVIRYGFTPESRPDKQLFGVYQYTFDWDYSRK